MFSKNQFDGGIIILKFVVCLFVYYKLWPLRFDAFYECGISASQGIIHNSFCASANISCKQIASKGTVDYITILSIDNQGFTN